jgi:hypothetical protein
VLDWLLHNATKVAAVIFVVASIVRSIRQAREGNATPPPPAGDLEQERREREVREKIRRRISERQGGATVAPESPPPVLAAETTEPETRPSLPRVASAPAVVKPVSVAAEMERQQRLADELRRIEEAKTLAARRAAHQAAEQTAAAQTTAALRRDARDELLADLREPASVRRAFLLREVLGSPTGLR